MQFSDLVKRLTAISNEYPVSESTSQLRDVPRIAFNILLALGNGLDRPYNELEICDLGGGVGLFSIGCAVLGVKRVVLVDDFRDFINLNIGESILNIHRKYGVEIVSADVIEKGLNGIVDGEFDVMTCFDSMEHWHNSPKKLFHEVANKLKSGGRFVLGVPNCVNMRKRLSVPLGFGKWSSMEEWYETPIFRGHVREPDVGDMKYVARDMRLVNVRIIGRNWLGYSSRNRWVRLGTMLFDYFLRTRPSLCSNIYMIGNKAN